MTPSYQEFLQRQFDPRFDQFMFLRDPTIKETPPFSEFMQSYEQPVNQQGLDERAALIARILGEGANVKNRSLGDEALFELYGTDPREALQAGLIPLQAKAGKFWFPRASAGIRYNMRQRQLFPELAPVVPGFTEGWEQGFTKEEMLTQLAKIAAALVEPTQDPMLFQHFKDPAQQLEALIGALTTGGPAISPFIVAGLRREFKQQGYGLPGAAEQKLNPFLTPERIRRYFGV